MKNLRLPSWTCLALLCLVSGCASAQTTPPASGPNMATTVSFKNLDASALATWDNGVETPITGTEKFQQPTWVVWSEISITGHNGIWFGDSKMPGVRHLRVGFKAPISVGTVLVRGGGALSFLKAGAPYPGDLNDEELWAPAQRLVDGAPSRAEVGNAEDALWVVPPGTKTTALRFSHTARLADTRYSGWLGGVFVMQERFSNLAPLGIASASSNNQNAALLNNGAHDDKPWESAVSDDSPVISNENPQWVLITWPSPVRLSGLLPLWTGFSAGEVQSYSGPANRHPRDAADSDWKTLKSVSGLKNGYPMPLWPNRIDFGQDITTRAIRVKMTAPTQESHPHLLNRTVGGKRVWFGELMALQSLDNAPLSPVKLADSTPKATHPPIPILFKLKEAGYVTLVIEDASGKRVRNLVAETLFPAGDNVAWWDGTNDLGRDADAARHGLYKIPAQFVEPGQYRVRGLVRGALDLRYEFSVYTEGNPPWPTPDHTGAWLANHTPPQGALYVPADRSPNGKEAVLLGSNMTEGRDGLAWVDLQGRKMGGLKWIGGVYSGAPYMTRDLGPKAATGIYAYVAAAWEGGLRLSSLQSNGADKSIFPAPWKFPGATPDEIKANTVVNGIAARDGLLAVSLGQLNQIMFVDAKSGKIVGNSKISDPRGLSFDASGRLWVLTGTKLVRFSNVQPEMMPAPQSVITSGLEDPRGLALDDEGNIYISDRGQSHQVKIFNSGGKLVRAIGKAGAPRAGAYDPLHMNNPDGITVDSKNQLWVAENDYLPKRVSVWSLDGKLLKAFYGPSKYGGGGSLDSSDKTRFYYADEGKGTLEFRLDWQKGDSQLVNVLYRPAPTDLKLAHRSAAPETALYRDGRRYFTNCFNTNPISGHSNAFLFLENEGVARPIAAAGRASDWDVLKGDAFKPFWPAGVDLNAQRNNQAFFLWSDTNDDSQVQPQEVAWIPAMTGGVTVMPDLSFTIARIGTKAVQFSPASFSAGGVPRYDLAQAKVLAENVATPYSSGGDQVLPGNGGWTVATLGVQPFSQLSISGLKNGVPTWSYPNLWPGLHASHEAPKPDRPGQVIGATRLLGGFISPQGSDAGQLWAVNGNMGNMYVFTADGLFVATLFEDVRQGQLWQMPQAQRNMKLDNISLHDENFWPSWSQTPDGKIYLQDGSNDALVRINGLNTIQRLPDMLLRLTADDLKGAQTYLVAVELLRQQKQGTGVLNVTRRAVTTVVDGKLDDWNGAAWVDIDKSGVKANFNSDSKPYDITGAVVVSGDRLYAAFRTANANLLQNSGELPTAPFKTGGALDLMLGTNAQADPKRANPVEGDLRLLVTMVKGKPRALIYRAVVPGTKTPVPFSSPWRTLTLDRVDDVSDQVQLAGVGGNYEISIPLAALGLSPQKGVTLKGDIGVLRGDGAQTTARTYWSNKATGITADVPSEAMLTPNLWGDWKFQ